MYIYVLAFLAALVPMLAIDAVWLSTMAQRFYAPHLGALMAKTPSLIPAGIFYLIYALGLSVFVVVPAIQGNYSVGKLFLIGALFGLVAYATYDLSNQATLKDWPVIVTMVDLAWGALVAGTVSVVAVFVTKYFL